LIYGEGKITISNNAINFITSFNLGGAITFGNTVIYAMEGKGPEYNIVRYDESRRIKMPIGMNIGMHEEAHTYQYQLLGILFFIPYLLSGGMWKPSPMEHAADNYSNSDRKDGWFWSKK